MLKEKKDEEQDANTNTKPKGLLSTKAAILTRTLMNQIKILSVI
jgi:hypothetical protein